MSSPKLTLLRYCAALFLFLLPCFTFAQEDCANGVDDDGDGLVDLNDVADCSCNLPSTTTSLLPNPSLEAYAADQEGCASRQPGGLPDATNQANCLIGWQRVSLGTTDAWNAFTLPGAPPSFPTALPQPLPSGTSVAGFWVGIKDTNGRQFTNGDGSRARQYREYLAACLEEGQQLTTGEDYRLTFSLGFMKPQTLELSYTFRTVDLASPGPVELSIYGVRDCAQLDFGEFYDCPEASGAEGYELIANVEVSGDPGSWTAATVDFVSPGTYSGFAIGGSCGEDLKREDGGRYRNYYFIDDLILNRREVFEQPVAGPVSVSGQTICAEEIVLTGAATPGATYQWYHDGRALAGANGRALTINPSPDIDGAYSLRVLTPGGCAVTEPVSIQRPLVYDQFPDSVALCRPGEAVNIYPAQESGASYTWSDGSTRDVFPVTEPGTYSVTVSTACVQRVEKFVATRTESMNYRYRLSPEQPCVGDTVEIVLETNWYAPLTVYFLPNGEQHYVEGLQPIKVVAGEVGSVQVFFVGSCGIVADRIVIPELQPLDPTATITALNCARPEGAIALDLPQGDIDIYWTDPDGHPISGSDSITASTPGTYTATLSGTGYCNTTKEFLVDSIDSFDLEVSSSDVICGTDATALALATGGTAPYTVDWYKDPDSPPVGRNKAVATDLDRGTWVATVSDAMGCKRRTPFTVQGPDPLRASVIAGYTECHSDTAGFLKLSTTGGTAPYDYRLGSKGAAYRNALINGLTSGSYQPLVTDANGCERTLPPTEVWLPAPFSIEAGADQTVSWGESATLELEVDGVSPYDGDTQWTPAAVVAQEQDEDPLTITVAPPGTTEYLVTHTSADGCTLSDSVTVVVDRSMRQYAPNAFSPNGDGLNDRFTLHGNPMVRAVTGLRIFDRWGGQVWAQEEGVTAEWDGLHGTGPASAGVYIYIARLDLRDGGEHEVQGSVLLLR